MSTDKELYGTRGGLTFESRNSLLKMLRKYFFFLTFAQISDLHIIARPR